MTIRILYFASLREALGCEGETVEPPAGVATVGALRDWLAARDGPWADALGAGRRVRTALDQAICGPESALSDGAEVAFFPPVTGG